MALLGMRFTQIFPRRLPRGHWNITQYRTCVTCSKVGAQVQKEVQTEKNTTAENSTKSEKRSVIQILGQHYKTDSLTNVTPRVLTKVGKNLHNKKHHPLNLIHQRIKNYFYTRYQNQFGNPQFTMFDDLKPVVTVHQNFDSLLIPEGLLILK